MGRSEINLEVARKLLAANAKAIAALEKFVDRNFAAVTEAIADCPGNVVVTGIGKAGLVGAKVSATLTATGTSSFFLHPVDALHGDLGRVSGQDLVMILSYSGASEEILRLIEPIKKRGAKIIAMTGNGNSPLSKRADWVLNFGEVEESSQLGLVPSASTTCMLVLGDALALTVMERRRFSVEDLAGLHPAGVLGRKMLLVEDVMGFRFGENLPVAPEDLSVREVLSQVSTIPRRCGAVLLTDTHGKLSGIFTDADLRRLLEKGNEAQFDRPISRIMVRNPKFIRAGALVAEAVKIIHQFRIDELPVLDEAGRPIGLIDIQDTLGIKEHQSVK